MGTGREADGSCEGRKHARAATQTAPADSRRSACPQLLARYRALEPEQKPKKPYVKLESVKTIFFAKYLYLTAEGTKDYRRDEKLWTDLFLAALLDFYRAGACYAGVK
jgi:hypothetical protein